MQTQDNHITVYYLKGLGLLGDRCWKTEALSSGADAVRLGVVLVTVGISSIAWLLPPKGSDPVSVLEDFVSVDSLDCDDLLECLEPGLCLSALEAERMEGTVDFFVRWSVEEIK